MGSNQNTKQLVRSGQLCYICEKAPPDLTDEVDGQICLPCYHEMQAMLWKYRLQGGYSYKEPRKRGSHTR